MKSSGMKTLSCSSKADVPVVASALRMVLTYPFWLYLHEGVSPAQSHIPALRHHQTQAALIHGASTLRSTATEDGPCWLGWLQLRPESIGFPSPPLDGCPNKSRSLTRIVVRLKRGWTRSRPLARPSRAFAFSQIPFAVSQTAQVPSQRPLCLPVVGQASRLTLTIKLPP
jgi:hypothetical protein